MAKKQPAPPFASTIAKIYEDFHDHRKFAPECLTGVDKIGRKFPYTLAPGPLKLRAAIEEQRAAGKPVRIVYLKARQVFVSTAVAAEFVNEVPFRAGQKAMIVAHESKSSVNLFSYYEQFIDSYKPFRGMVRLPAERRRTASRITWENGSYVDISTANNLKGGRSFSLRYLHLSEFAFWRDAKTLMGGLTNSVPNDPDTMIVIESTANGVGGEFYRLCQEAMDPASGSQWKFVFLAWWEHPEYTRRIEDRAGFQKSLDKEEIELRDRYRLTLEQLAWRRWKIRNECHGSVDLFHQEFPSCPEEAFVFTGRPRFSHQHLARMPVNEGGLPGEIEAYQEGPRQIITFREQDRGSMVVYKRPIKGREYVAGADLAEGRDAGDGSIGNSDPDWSVLQILDRDTGEQVAKVRARLHPAPFADYCHLVLQWYNWAFVCPEVNGPGVSFIETLLRNGYPPSRMYHRRPDPDEQFSSEAYGSIDKIGFRTTQVTRVQIISSLDTAIRELSILVHDPVTLQELRTFVTLPTGKQAAQDGAHDDEVFALALANVALLHPPADPRLAQARQATRQANAPVTNYRTGRLPYRDGRGDLVRF